MSTLQINFPSENTVLPKSPISLPMSCFFHRRTGSPRELHEPPSLVHAVPECFFGSPKEPIFPYGFGPTFQRTRKVVFELASPEEFRSNEVQLPTLGSSGVLLDVKPM